MTERIIKTGSFKKDENAVSPVIGVILMVAITVILAAVIGAFVFGMGSGVSKTYIVAATATQMGSNITVTYNGGPDADYVTSLSAQVTPPGGSATNHTLTSAVGESKTFTTGTGGKEDHVVVVATFDDGSMQVVLDTYV